MFLWEVNVGYDGLVHKENTTLVIATRRKILSDAQKKAASYLRANTTDYPKAKVLGITYRGRIDA